MPEPTRHYPDRPLVGVGVVIWREGKVLLVKRGKEPQSGQWAFPGGAQDLGETLFGAAAREVLEETSIVIEPYTVITALDLIERDGGGIKYHYTLVEIAARYVSGEAVAANDAEAVQWFDPGEISTLNAWKQVGEIIDLCQQHFQF